METGGQTYVEKCQTDSFRAHLWRRPHQDGTYHYEVEYLIDPIALSSPLEDNYMQSYHRHKQLRMNYGQLTTEAQVEFRDRLTKGLSAGYWRILEEKEALHLRETDGLYLPAGFVLKRAGTTKAGLILDPKGSLNSALLKALNLEKKIASVLRKCQALPILLSSDVREAFFKIKVAPASRHLSLCLMDYEESTKQLKPQQSPISNLASPPRKSRGLKMKLTWKTQNLARNV